MNSPLSLPDELVRSKGQAIVIPETGNQLTATIRDISLTDIGMLAPTPIDTGLRVQIDIHGHCASGVVLDCRPDIGRFYIAVKLDAAAA